MLKVKGHVVLHVLLLLLTVRCVTLLLLLSVVRKWLILPSLGCSGVIIHVYSANKFSHGQWRGGLQQLCVCVCVCVCCVSSAKKSVTKTFSLAGPVLRDDSAPVVSLADVLKNANPEFPTTHRVLRLSRPSRSAFTRPATCAHSPLPTPQQPCATSAVHPGCRANPEDQRTPACTATALRSESASSESRLRETGPSISRERARKTNWRGREGVSRVRTSVAV